MKKLIILSAAAVLTLGLMAACSDDDTTPTGATGANLNDPDLLAMQDFIDESDGLGSWERSMDLSFALLDYQFPGPVSRKSDRWYNGAAAAADVSIISATYTYNDTTGWHVWDVTAQLVDESDTVDVMGTDSVRIIAFGVTQDGTDTSLSLTDIDTLYARVHFQWQIVGTACSGIGHHSVQLHLLATPTPLGSMVLNADIVDSLDAAAGCFSDNCSLLLVNTVAVTDLTFPMEQVGMSTDPAECPSSGSLSLSADVDLACSGAGDPNYDSLTVNGTWTITATVFSPTNIRFTFTDGTTNWTFSEDCTADSTTVRPHLPRSRAGE